MNLIALLFKQFKLTLVFTMALSITSASLAVVVMAYVNDHFLHAQRDLAPALLEFMGLLVLAFIIGTLAQASMTQLGHRLVCQLRQTLVKRVLDTPLEHLEQLGPGRILASLSGDIQHLTSAFINLPNSVYGLTLTVGGLSYLAWLSLPLFGATAAWLLLTVLVAWLLMVKTYLHIDQARATEDLLCEDYQAVLSGRKELALNQDRARSFYQQDFSPHAKQSKNQDIRADRLHSLNENWTNAMMLGAIAWVFFLAHEFRWGSHETATTFSLTLLFLRTPLTGLVSALPSLLAGGVALTKLNSLDLAAYQADFRTPSESDCDTWQTLTLNGVTYRHPHTDGNRAFTVGPLQFTLKRGETVFIVGGNGSGKTTFLRLLTGLYTPQQGTVEVDKLSWPQTAKAAYRKLFAAVFADFYLFPQLLGPNGQIAANQDVHFWLARLELTNKTEIIGDRLSDTRLSQGQRKRLALLLAILEDRPVIVLDEWAADQDPGYRRTFYQEILPLLKTQGKTVVAVSHDETYFDCADRVVKMVDGLLFDLTAVTHKRH